MGAMIRKMVARGAWEQSLTGKGHERTFWADNKSLYLDQGLGYTGLDICQNTANVSLRFIHVCCI